MNPVVPEKHQSNVVHGAANKMSNNFTKTDSSVSLLVNAMMPVPSAQGKKQTTDLSKAIKDNNISQIR